MVFLTFKSVGAILMRDHSTKATCIEHYLDVVVFIGESLFTVLAS